MAASQLTVQQVLNTGLEATFSSANADGNYFINDGKTFIEIVNSDGSDHNIVIDSPVECNQGSSHDITVTVTAGERRHIGPLSKSRFNDDNGYVNVTYSAVTSVTIAVMKL